MAAPVYSPPCGRVQVRRQLATPRGISIPGQHRLPPSSEYLARETASIRMHSTWTWNGRLVQTLDRVVSLMCTGTMVGPWNSCRPTAVSRRLLHHGHDYHSPIRRRRNVGSTHGEWQRESALCTWMATKCSLPQRVYARLHLRGGRDSPDASTAWPAPCRPYPVPRRRPRLPAHAPSPQHGRPARSDRA